MLTFRRKSIWPVSFLLSLSYERTNVYGNLFQSVKTGEQHYSHIILSSTAYFWNCANIFINESSNFEGKNVWRRKIGRIIGRVREMDSNEDKKTLLAFVMKLDEKKMRKCYSDFWHEEKMKILQIWNRKFERKMSTKTILQSFDSEFGKYFSLDNQ